jgi:hypothetical protein
MSRPFHPAAYRVGGETELAAIARVAELEREVAVKTAALELLALMAGDVVASALLEAEKITTANEIAKAEGKE